MSNLEENIKKIKRLIKYMDIDQNENLESEISEEGEAAASSGGGASKGYPTVTKWETGLTRGPGNPIGNAKRADKTNRGKANRLI